MKAIADAVGVARSHLVERVKTQAKLARTRYNKADDAWLLPLIRELVDGRMTYGYRRIGALHLTAGWREWAGLLSTTSASIGSCTRMACC